MRSVEDRLADGPLNAAVANETGKLVADFTGDELRRAMEPRLITVIEGLTGRRVRRFLSGTSTLAEASVEVFVLEPELTTQ